MLRFLIAVTVLVLANQLHADNWPHWRGDGGNGVSATAKPPTAWSDTNNVKWKVAIPGRSSGSPVIWEDKVFVVTAVKADNQTANTAEPRPPVAGRRQRGGAALTSLDFQIHCYSRADGEKLWAQSAVVAKPHEGTHSTNGFASASPCTDGEHVYAHFGSRGLFCYTMDGTPVWKRTDLGEMKTRATFGEGSSPTIFEDMIIVPWDHEGASYITALNKLNGDEIWKTPRDEPTCWATPLIVNHDGKDIIVMNGQTCARAYDAKTGEELWRCRGQTQRPVASAVANDELVFVGSGFRGAFLGAFNPSGRGDLYGSKDVVWSIDADTPDIASPVLSENRLYFHKGKNGIISCLDAATGKPFYMTKRLPELRMIYASPVAAGGHVYFTGRSGKTVVIKDTKTFEVVSVNSVGETVDATPAPVDNELFIRGENHLFCISES